MEAVKGDRWITLVLPTNLVRSWVNFYHPGEGRTRAMTAVVEEEDMPVIQVCVVVLVGNCARSPLPTEVPCVLVDDTYRVGTSEADQQVALGGYFKRVLVGPLLSVF